MTDPLVIGAGLPEPRRRRDPNVVAMLSLFLLLLAFFILLNALSQLEQDKSRVVLESVNEAFDGQVRSNRSKLPLPAALRILPNAAELFGELGDLFMSHVPAVRVEASPDADLLRLTLPEDAIFQPGGLEPHPGWAAMLDRFVAVLNDARYRHLAAQLKIDHGMAPNAMGKVAEAGAASLEVGRMGALARDMVARGFPENRLAAGVFPGRAGKITFSLRPWPRTDPDPASSRAGR